MSALTWKVTAAGRAALVNAANTGTLPLLVSQIGITGQAFVAAADGSDLVLPGELKRLTTFAGDAVAADTIHVSITDDSTDTYTLRGFALYFDTGVLFGIYGQAEPILEKSTQAMMMLAFDAIFADIDATSLSFGDTNFALPPATTERTGIVELATVLEAITGTDSTRAMTPSTYKAALDDRLGMGAPSGFVKGLLTQATAALFRAALALKGAALKDEGAGKGLDADLLDGQHGSYYRAWANLTGVPSQFPPTVHGHAWGDISGVPVYATRWPAWSEVTGKPTSFTPAPHSQGWDTITSKPTKFPPIAHTHDINDVTHLSGGADWARLSQSPDNSDIGFSYRIYSTDGGGYWTWNGATIFKVSKSGAINAYDDIVGARQITSHPQTVAENSLDAIDGATFFCYSAGIDGCGLQMWSPGQRTQLRSGLAVNPLQVRVDDGVPGSTWAGTGWFNVIVDDGAGNVSVAGAMNCLTVNATGSDIRLKTGVQTVDPRPLHRQIAELPGTCGVLTTYIHRVDGAQRRGPIAQDVERVDPSYTGTIELRDGQVDGVDPGTYKTVDKAGLAYEQAMWAGQEIDRLSTVIAELQTRLAAVESR